jgi:hypothetical protein
MGQQPALVSYKFKWLLKESNVRISKHWILALTMTILPLLVAFNSGTVAAQEGPISAINNPNPGAELWQAVRGRLDTPATTQVKGHDSAVLVNQQGDNGQRSGIKNSSRKAAIY